MEKICRALCLSQNNSSNVKSCKKNEEITTSEDWKLPPFPASDVYKPSRLFSSSPIKTVEKEIPLSEGYATFPLFSDNLKSEYRKYSCLHFGMIQVGLKPIKPGSNSSAVICVRDKRRPSFDESVLAMAESSLHDGPIYFSYFPPPTTPLDWDRSSNIESIYVYLSEDLSSSLSIDIKTQGDDDVILFYRLHYRMLMSGNSRSRRARSDLYHHCVDKMGTTTVFLRDRNHVWPKKMSWYDEVALPERWVGWKETAEEHLLQLNIPAAWKKEEIDVTVEAGRILRIWREKNDESDQKWGEEPMFLRRLRLPENGKAEEVRAVMENGVLVVVVPKEEINEELKEKVVGIIGC